MKEGWEAIIGMEIHAQLATNTKIFCGCAVNLETLLPKPRTAIGTQIAQRNA